MTREGHQRACNLHVELFWIPVIRLSVDRGKKRKKKADDIHGVGASVERAEARSYLYAAFLGGIKTQSIG